MSSFEALSWDTLTKLSSVAVERDSFDLVLKPSEDSDSFRATLSQLVLLRFLLASITL